jgi:hypothetical protein
MTRRAARIGGVFAALGALSLAARARAAELAPNAELAPVRAPPAEGEPGAEFTPREPSVDVVVRDASPPLRSVSIEWNPVPLVTLDKLSLNFVIVPVTHHAIVLAPFGVRTHTAPIAVFDDAGNATSTPTYTFSGFGSEFGYRYYTGERGPRGFFAGPSVILGAFSATAADGSRVRFTNAAVAADVGYESLLAERVSLGLGAGVAYTFAASSLPEQQFPARIYANRGFFPRFLVSFGWAL